MKDALITIPNNPDDDLHFWAMAAIYGPKGRPKKRQRVRKP